MCAARPCSVCRRVSALRQELPFRVAAQSDCAALHGLLSRTSTIGRGKVLPLRPAPRQIGGRSCFSVHGNNWNDSLALDFEFAQRLSLETILDPRPHFTGHRYAAWHRLAGHACGDIDGVTPNVELVTLLSNNASDD